MERPEFIIEFIKSVFPCSGEVVERYTDHLEDMIFDLFRQGCLMPDDMYSHDHISAYEEVQEHLLKIGRIKSEECRYK